MNSAAKFVSKTKKFYFPFIYIKRTKKHSVVKPNYITIKDEDEFELSPYKKSSQKFINVLGILHKKDVTWSEIKEWFKWKNIESIKKDQRFILQRHKILGFDLAATHFILARGGKVRFKGSEKWLTKEALEKNEIPCKFAPNIYVEAIDASDTELCYEGFVNLINLYHIKELLLRNCKYVDDHVLHRLYIMKYSLEKLDISGCQNVTEYGICTLHSLKQLKLLIVEDTPEFLNKELTCLLLQEVLPELQVQGVNYDNPALLRRLKRYL